ncbi:MAG: hypothetical protein RM368_27105 [Nostoc sp. DedSLP03]|nr:hypothetical protein [Nostoc sp. DedSLP03]
MDIFPGSRQICLLVMGCSEGKSGDGESSVGAARTSTRLSDHRRHRF